jgi:SPP1 gp7 family putative phage head morphogenesis protein
MPRRDQRTIFGEVNADLERAVAGVGVRFGSPEFVARARRIAAEWGDRVLTHNRRQVLRQIREVLGVPFAGGDAAALAQVGRFVEAAVDLIVTIPTRLLDDVRETVLEAAPQGLRVEELTAQIEARFGVSESRAALIARDQTLKLNGSVTQVRQTSVGIRSYTWSTSLDERVRPFHADLEGTVQAWDSPPVVSEDGRREHPGGDFQ